MWRTPSALRAVARRSGILRSVASPRSMSSLVPDTLADMASDTGDSEGVEMSLQKLRKQGQAPCRRRPSGAGAGRRVADRAATGGISPPRCRARRRRRVAVRQRVATASRPRGSPLSLRAARPGASRLTCAGVSVSSAARADAWPAASDRDDAPPAAAARGGRGVLLHVVMRRHMGRRSPSQHPGGLCERSRRGSAARRGCYTCGTKGRGGRKKARAARGGRPARGACH